MAPPPVRRFNPWPLGLLAFFVFIILATAAFVVMSRSHKVDLVSADYYEQEVKYQDQIERVRRTSALREPVGIVLDEATQELRIQMPSSHAGRQPRGSVALYRPAGAELDRQFPLAIDGQGSQVLDVKGMATGLWRVRVTWKLEQEEFFGETNIVVGRRKS